MTPGQFEQARALFEQAQALSEAEQRALLAERCAGEPELMALVSGLLRRARAHQAEQIAPVAAAAGDLLIGAQIGPYRIRGVLGEGGMGTVYEAEHKRTHQVVALKLVRPGLATPDMLRRFEFELQVLARLEHPGIARIYHADTADIGGGPQPYFAMELVRGQNLIEYAKGQKLTIRQRLELAARIADGVQHAHQQGVIHRDLKPGNIFVTAEGQPKILDFGVARATDSDVQSTLHQAEVGQLVGTLQYMSPEQTSGDPAQIDTRSDVYSLGTVIYELLAGRPPYQLSSRMLHDAVRIIREEEPARLSTVPVGVWSTIRELRGDVETIVGKALEKNKERRYASANALAADIRRYLNDEPIAARPPSATYQIAKFAKRNKVLVGAGAMSLVLLLAGLVVTSLLWQRAAAAELKEAGERKRAEHALLAADAQRDVSMSLVELLYDAGRDGKPVGTELRSYLEQRRSQLSNVPAQIDPVRKAALLEVLGYGYMIVGDPKSAVELLDAAAVLQVGSPAAPAVRVTIAAADMLLRLGRPADAEVRLRQVLAHVERVHGTASVEAAEIRNLLAGAIKNQARLDDAESLYQDALRVREAVLGEQHIDTLVTRYNLCLVDMARLSQMPADAPEKAAFLDRVAQGMASVFDETRDALGIENVQTFAVASELIKLRALQNRLDEAQSLCADWLSRMTSVLDPLHWRVLECQARCGRVAMLQQRYSDAAHLFGQAAAGYTQVRGRTHPDTLTLVQSLADAHQALGDAGAERTVLEDLLARLLELGDAARAAQVEERLKSMAD